MAYLRFIAPFRQIGIRIINGLQNDQSVSELVLDGDMVIIQREFPVRFDDYQKVVEIARREGKPIVFELDDLLFFLPEDHPDRLAQCYASSLLPMLQALSEADVVTVSTPRLRDVLVDYNENIIVLPNCLDDNLWPLTPPALKDSSHGTLTVGYMGTNSHRPDLEYITPVLLNLIQRYPRNVSFHFWGTQPSAELSLLPQVRWTPCYFRSYEEFAAFFQTQSADIFIAPLADNLFNRCKSPLKFFEYSALGTPGVFSRLEPYEGVVKHEQNGLLASSLAEWENCLIQLIENDELRFQLAINAQTTIRENWLISQNASRWGEAFQSAFEVKKRKKWDTPTACMIRSINIQLSEAFQALTAQVAERDQTIQELTTQLTQARSELEQLRSELEQLRSELEQLRGEILRYVLSRSWQITRPFRKIGKKSGVL